MRTGAAIVTACLGLLTASALAVSYSEPSTDRSSRAADAVRDDTTAGRVRTETPTTAGGFPVPPVPAGVPDAPAPLVPSELAGAGIPATALSAYVSAAAAPGCGLDWALLAAIGRVESDHGRVGGSVLTSNGTSVPPIRGPRLDGVVFALIREYATFEVSVQYKVSNFLLFVAI